MGEEDNWKWQKKLLIKRDKEHQKEIEKLNYIIDKQDRDIVALSNGNRKLKEKIDKAIEHLKEVMKDEEEYEEDYIYNKYLLDILQGSERV